jgi:hypothetical protein
MKPQRLVPLEIADWASALCVTDLLSMNNSCVFSRWLDLSSSRDFACNRRPGKSFTSLYKRMKMDREIFLVFLLVDPFPFDATHAKYCRYGETAGAVSPATKWEDVLSSGTQTLAIVICRLYIHHISRSPQPLIEHKYFSISFGCKACPNRNLQSTQ